MDLEKILDAIKDSFLDSQKYDAREKIKLRDFVVHLVFGFNRDRGDQRSLEGLRKSIESSADQRIARSSFWERLATNRLNRFLENVIIRMIHDLGSLCSITSELLNALNVSAIVLLDSSSCSLPEGARDNFPAPRNNVAPAAIKLHLCFDIIRGSVHWFKMTPATSHDRKSFPPLKTLIGKLAIFDLGYWDYLLLAQIKGVGGFFLSRVKSNATITVIKVIQGLPSKRFVGQRLFDKKLKKAKGTILEVLGEFRHDGKAILEARVIGFWNPISREYHWYVTNLTASAAVIYPLYRLRWQIELIFKTFKSSFRLGDLPSSNPKIIVSLMYAAIIANIIAHPIAIALAMEKIEDRRMTVSLQRAGAVLVQVSHEFLNFILGVTKNSIQQLINKFRIFQRDLFDPNYNRRETSLARVTRIAISPT